MLQIIFVSSVVGGVGLLGARHACMRGRETRVQLLLALLGIPLVFFVWRPDAKWPNPWRQQPLPPPQKNE